MQNKTYLITGASKGFGYQLTKSFWQANYSLILVARSNLEKVQDELLAMPKNVGQECQIIRADLSKEDDVKRIISQLRFSKLDGLINNAAIHGPIGDFVNNDWQKWQEAIQVDLFSPILLTKLCIPYLLKSNNGKIINISGGGATSSRPNFTAYGVAKTALVRFSETLAEELKDTSITVNCIAPGAMPTMLLNEVIVQGEKLSGTKEYKIAQKTMLENTEAMQKACDLALFLASEASNGITGKLISAVWDDYKVFPEHLEELKSDLYTLRRITARDRNKDWGDK